jgi:alpha-amylase
MKRLSFFLLSLLMPLLMMAQGWPANYSGVMLQGFYWDSYADSQWSNLESQADELSPYFSLIWVPNSGYCGSTTNLMGYTPVYWYNHLSCFGTEDQLRSMIKTFKAKGTGIIEDVVINHRNGVTSWTDFPAETVDGVTWQLTSADICRTDECVKSGYAATGAADTGDDFDGARDLDHTSANVQANVKNYLNYLLNNLGYAGFRYDMVKGYAPKYTSLYNVSSNPTFSVGEYWDGSLTKVENWLNGTKDDSGNIRSAAFDYPLKYLINNSCNKYGNWNTLSGACLTNDANYRRYGVTFVDNHDTYRNDNKTTGNILAANAFILSVPGTPCIFLPHWQLYKAQIKQLILARQLAQINNQSTMETLSSSTSVYAVRTVGTDGHSIIVVMGSGYKPSTDYTLIQSGQNYAVYLSNNVEMPWVDTPSGTFDNAIDVKLTALSAATDAQLVYTTDGTEPTTTNGTRVASGTSIHIAATTTLKVGLLTAGVVKGVITRAYTITNFTPTKVTVYVRADWPVMYFYAWDATSTLLSAWPGSNITDTKEINGEKWYYHTFDKNTSSYRFNIIFDKGSSSDQTVDIDNIDSDRYFELSADKNSAGKYTVNDVTSTITAVSAPTLSKINAVRNVTTVDGRIVRTLPAGTSVSDALLGLPHGIYIVGGQKVIR